MRWHILTGEYPPQEGGVADYTQLVARGLAAAGDAVDVWAPVPADARDPAGVVVHALPDHFGARSLSALTRGLRDGAEPHRVLVQYVPHAFGWKGSNVPFCLWLRSRTRDAVWVMFHEVAFPIARHQRLAQNGLGVVTRGMAALVASAAERAFVSIPAWEPLVRKAAAPATPVEWMPVPSAIPVDADARAIAAVRERHGVGRAVVGHFGTFGRLIQPLLAEILPRVVGETSAHVLLIGRGSDAVAQAFGDRHPSLRARVTAAGALDGRAVSHHVAACDLMLQPYPDGVSSRRTSVMVALSHGRPVVTTSGALTERLWHEAGGVTACPVGDAGAVVRACARLLAAPSDLERAGRDASALYDARFDVRHTIAMLRAAEPAPAGLRAVS